MSLCLDQAATIGTLVGFLSGPPLVCWNVRWWKNDLILFSSYEPGMGLYIGKYMTSKPTYVAAKVTAN